MAGAAALSGRGSSGGITFEKLITKYYPEQIGFRARTPCFPIELNFIFMNGGMGDYITWMQAIRWLASEATWIKGTLIVPKYFRELAEYWLKPFPEWRFVDYVTAPDVPKLNETPFRGPVDLQRESLNATGAHLSTCGWVYFTNKESAPDGWDFYPPFKQEDLDAVVLCPDAAQLKPKSYAVITTGMTTDSRKVPEGGWNPVIQHVIKRGLTPVFLGKEVVETGNARNIHTNWGKTTRYDLGTDLRDKTSLLQAASIMSRAAFVVGHDNGLLHLAGCTEVPIIFGYNLASPKHREPKRPVGKTYNILLSKEELACTMCQSNFNFVIGYNFRSCFYRDTLCMSMLFEKEAYRWTEGIDLVLKRPAQVE